MIGEIRDRETAQMAVRSALTGHVVFSTIHTNDAPSAITRLIDMGVKPFLVAAAVQAVMAQRLVRRLCPECSEAYKPSESELAALRLDARFHGDREFRRARGCRVCEGTGYKGRTGLFEVLEMDEALRDMTFRGAGLDEVRRQALSTHRLRPLVADGARKVLAGATTATEVLRVTRAEDD